MIGTRYMLLLGILNIVAAGLVANAVAGDTERVAAAGSGGGHDEVPDQIEALRSEIDALLDASGVPAEPQSQRSNERLADVARRSRALGGQIHDSDQQLEVNKIEMRAYNALVHEASQARREAMASYRLSQLRKAANETRRLPAAQARVTADYWLLLADLTDINRNTQTQGERRSRAIDRLEAFVASHGSPSVEDTSPVAEPDAVPPERILTDVRWALLRLHDQVGHNRAAAVHAAVLSAAIAPDDPRRPELDGVSARGALVGQPVVFAGGRTPSWSVPDHRGRVVLLHIFADAPGPDRQDIDRLIAAQDGLAPRGLRVVSIRLGMGPQEQEMDLPWPVVESGAAGVAGLFAIGSLPSFVVIDSGGKIAAIGRSAAVLDTAQSLVSPAAGAAAEPARFNVEPAIADKKTEDQVETQAGQPEDRSEP